MLLLRSLPDLSNTNAELLSSFHAKWGRENCIVWGRARRHDFGPHTHTLSIRAAWGGAQHCHVGPRTVAVDDDNFLILNQGRIYSTSISATHPVESLSICFAPGLAEKVHLEAAMSIERALQNGEGAAERSADFIENLQPHDRTISPVLRFIRWHLARGVVDENWYEEQLLFLLERMQSHHAKAEERIDRLAAIRPSTRREIHRRIGLAIDFMNTHYAEQIDLETLAKTAFLSKFHFLRQFTLIHEVTPHRYLQRKRVRVAIRLLEQTELPVKEIAARVGFIQESTLVRQMHNCTGLAPRQIRSRFLSESGPSMNRIARALFRET